MGLRDRFKKMKNRSGSSTPGSQTPKIEYYKPGEEPKLKYGGKIFKEHNDKLHAFSFSDAWSRGRSQVSITGTMSPGGTMAQSRATSIVGSLKGRKRSVASYSGSDTDVRRKSLGVEPETIPATVKENEDDDTNVQNAGGLSRPQTSGGKPAELLAHAPTTHAQPEPPGNANGAPLENTATNGRLSPTHDVPFSTEELERAMSCATMEAPGDVARGGEIAAH
jgi:hypothetical protein